VAFSQVGGQISLASMSGQGRGRTADLPLFRRTLVPTELPDRARGRSRKGGWQRIERS
jgi:hypothetical protein